MAKSKYIEELLDRPRSTIALYAIHPDSDHQGLGILIFRPHGEPVRFYYADSISGYSLIRLFKLLDTYFGAPQVHTSGEMWYIKHGEHVGDTKENSNDS